MLNLLRADFHRLIKNKIFRLFSVLLSVYFLSDALITGIKFKGFVFNPTDPVFFEKNIYYMAYINFVAVIIFSCLFAGADFSSKTVRNKIFCGHKRIEIYLSSLIVNMTASAVFMLPVIFAETACAYVGFTKFNVGIILFFIALLLSFACTSLCCAAAFITGSRIAALIISILIIGSMLALNFYIEDNIFSEEPELNFIVSVNGKPYVEDTPIPGDAEVIWGTKPNPGYPSERKRKICSTADDILPAHQFINLAGIRIDSLNRYSCHIADCRNSEGDSSLKYLKTAEDVNDVFSLYGTVIFIFTVNAVGIIVFNKKDLK